MATEWFCRIMDEQWGPMSSQEMTMVARRGRLTRDDLVRCGQKGTWVRAEIVDGLFSAEAPAEPAAPRRRAIGSKATPAKRSVGHASSTQYWISNGHRTAGPFTSRQVRRLAANGRLDPEYLIRSERSGWVPAEKVKGLAFGNLEFHVAAAESAGVLSLVKREFAHGSTSIPQGIQSDDRSSKVVPLPAISSYA